MEDEKTANNVQFAVSMSTDRDHFVRLTCPSCGLDFKTEIDMNDLQWVLASQCRRMGLEVGEQPEDPSPPLRIHCPYCSFEDEARQMHTEDTVEYLKRILYREYVFPQIQKMFSGLEDLTGHHGGSGGFLSISIECKFTRAVLPPRPIHGPEPADMKIITFLCCGQKMKVSDRWNDIEICPFCETAVTFV